MKKIMVGLALSISCAAAWSAEPCCGIIAIDSRAGMVSVKNTKTGKVTQYTAVPINSIKALKVGQQVDLIGGQLRTVTGANIAGRVQP